MGYDSPHHNFRRDADAGRRRVQSARKTVPLLATVLHVADAIPALTNAGAGVVLGK